MWQRAWPTSERCLNRAPTSPDDASGTRGGRFGLLRRGGRALALALVPLVVSFALLDRVIGTELSLYSAGWSDEAFLWHQAATFAVAGWDGGYYSYQEVLPPAGTPWGAWGAGAPVLYGSVMALFGTPVTAIVQVNAVLVGAAAGIWGWFARGGIWPGVVFGVLLAMYGPIHLYTLSGMQEPVHLALAIVIGLVLALLLQAPRDGRLQVLAAMLILTAAVIRPTWAFLLLALPPGQLRGSRRWAAWVGALIGVGLMLLLFAQTAAPYPYETSTAWRVRNTSSIAEGLGVIADNAVNNARFLADDARLRVPVGLVTAYQLLALASAGIALLLATANDRVRPLRRLAWTLTIVVLPALIFVTAVYEVTNGTRVLGPHVLCAASLLLARGGKTGVVLGSAVVLASTASTSWFLTEYEQRTRLNYSGLRGYPMPDMSFRPGGDRWCDTILYTLNGGGIAGPVVYSVPAGMGIGLDVDHAFSDDVRARWVLGDAATPSIEAFASLELVGETPVGHLYRNPRPGSCPD